MKRFLLLMMILLTTSVITLGEKIEVIAPDGLPALSLVKMMKDKKELSGVEVNYTIEKISDSLLVNMLKRKGDFAIVPSNFSAQLHNKNLKYKILGTVNWGSFYIISRENFNSLEDLRGKTLYTFGKGLTPDIVLKNILLSYNLIPEKDIKINYLSSGNELATMYLGKKVDIVVIPEPMLSKILSKDVGTNINFSLNDIWKNMIFSDLGYPQATLVVKEEIFNTKPELIEEFIEELKSSIAFLYKGEEERKEYIENSGVTVEISLLDSILKRAGLFFTPINDCKEEYERYFKTLYEINSKAIGGKIPDEKIYGY